MECEGSEDTKHGRECEAIFGREGRRSLLALCIVCLVKCYAVKPHMRDSMQEVDGDLVSLWPNSWSDHRDEIDNLSDGVERTG
jgi:hypothetical protein